MGVEKLEFGGHVVDVDPNNLRFDETTLNEYIQKEGGYYDYFGAFLSLAERNLQNKETMYEKLYNERFIEAKEDGAAVALAEAKAKVDPVVTALKDEVIEAKYIVNRLKQHLRAWDKNHDNAQSMGHMLRKQIDKLHAEISMRTAGLDPSEIPGLDDAIARTVRTTHWEPEREPSKQDEDTSGFETDLGLDNLY